MNELQTSDASYYDRPMLKAPVWKLYIPSYYFLGGAAGAALALGSAAQLNRSPDLRNLIRRAHWIGIIGSTIGGGFLILDLGKPLRFLNMLRVFRPTSPMNMGAWILAGTAPAAITAGLFVRSQTGWRTIGEAAGYISGLLGLALSTYTGVLVANSAIPLWQESRRILPLLFGASGMSAAGSILNLFDDNEHASAVTRNFAIAGAVAELAGSCAMERHASRVKRVGAPLKQGRAGMLWRAASLLTGISVVAALLPRQTRKTRTAAGICGVFGSLMLRFAVHYGGEQSAQDPRASFHLQRAIASAKSGNR